MTNPLPANLYTQGFGSRPENIEIPTYQTRAPATTDVQWPLGKRWIDTVGNAEYSLTSFTTFNGSVTANWQALGGGSAAVSTETGDTGTAVPSAGNIKHAGTANQITTAASGSTVTYSIPTTFIAPGSIASTTTVTGGTGITATTGNITATNGNFVATAAGTGIVTTPVIGPTGASPLTANGRVVSATFSGVSIAAADTQSLVIANSSITSASQIGLVSWEGATTGAALNLQSVVNDGTGHTTTFTFCNGTGATTSTANITITYVLLN